MACTVPRRRNFFGGSGAETLGPAQLRASPGRPGLVPFPSLVARRRHALCPRYANGSEHARPRKPVRKSAAGNPMRRSAAGSPDGRRLYADLGRATGYTAYAPQRAGPGPPPAYQAPPPPPPAAPTYNNGPLYPSSARPASQPAYSATAPAPAPSRRPDFSHVHPDLRKFEEDKYFRSQMSSRRLQVVDCKADGNCLFRAISQQCYGNEDYHAAIRKAVCDYMRSQEERFKWLVDPPTSAEFRKYVSAREQPVMGGVGEWGDHAEIIVIEELCDRHVGAFSDVVRQNRAAHVRHTGKHGIARCPARVSNAAADSACRTQWDHCCPLRRTCRPVEIYSAKDGADKPRKTHLEGEMPKEMVSVRSLEQSRLLLFVAFPSTSRARPVAVAVWALVAVRLSIAPHVVCLIAHCSSTAGHADPAVLPRREPLQRRRQPRNRRFGESAAASEDTGGAAGITADGVLTAPWVGPGHRHVGGADAA